MKKTLDRVSWKYKDGKFKADDGSELKEFGYIGFAVELNPICGDGNIEYLVHFKKE